MIFDMFSIRKNLSNTLRHRHSSVCEKLVVVNFSLSIALILNLAVCETMRSSKGWPTKIPQIIAVNVKNVLLLVYGLTMGMPTMLIPNLAGGVPGESIVLDEDGISWIGAVTRRYGRIRSMQTICVLFSGAFLLFHFACRAWHVLLGLFLTGFSGGLLEAPLLQAPVDSYYATILIGTMELLGSALLMLLVRYLGKRKLMFVSQLGISSSFLLVGIYAYSLGVDDFESINSINEGVAMQYSWVPLLTIVSVGFFSYLMVYTLPWIIMGELYPNDIRDTASGLSAATGYIIGFLANKTFLNLVGLATLAGVFWIYSAVAIIGLASMYFLLPETGNAPEAQYFSCSKCLSTRTGPPF